METINVQAHIECNKRGYYTVYTNYDFPFGLFGEGNTEFEAKADFLNIFAKMCKEHNMSSKDFEFIFCLDVSALLQRYKGIITLSGLSKMTGINKTQISQYACGTRKASEKTAKKIQTALQDFGRELVALNF